MDFHVDNPFTNEKIYGAISLLLNPFFFHFSDQMFSVTLKALSKRPIIPSIVRLGYCIEYVFHEIS